MRTTPARLVVLFLALVATSKLFATEYYVDANAKDSGEGSVGTPFATVQQAADIMKPGDVCIVREGVYREMVRPENSGTAEAPLVFRVFPGETVVLSGCDPVTGWNQEESHIYSAAAPHATWARESSVSRPQDALRSEVAECGETCSR